MPGDILLVWRLDRLDRSVRHLLDLVEGLRKRGVGLKSICDGAIDTTTASGELNGSLSGSARFILLQMTTPEKRSLAARQVTITGQERVLIGLTRHQAQKIAHPRIVEIRHRCKTAIHFEIEQKQPCYAAEGGFIVMGDAL